MKQQYEDSENRNGSYRDLKLGFLVQVEEMEDHDCTLHTRDIREEVLDQIYHGHTHSYQKCTKAIRGSWLVSRKHPYTKYVFKSTTAINREIRRHAQIGLDVIHPFSQFRSIWEIVMVFIYLSRFLCDPFIVALVSHNGIGLAGFGFWNYYLCIMFVITLFDVVINFRSGYVARNSKEIILSKCRIASHYILTHFIFDLASSIPYDFILIVILGLPKSLQKLRVLYLLRIVRIATLYAYSKQMFERFNASYVTSKVIITVGLVVIFLNWVACMYPLKSIEEGSQDMDLGSFWRHNLAVAVSNILGCDMHLFIDRKPLQMLTYIADICVGYFVLIYVAVQVVIVTRIVNATTSRYEAIQQNLRDYIRYKQIPSSLEKRLLEYSKFAYVKTCLDESLVLSFLSPRLRQEVLLHNCSHLIDQMPFFRTLPPDIIERLVASLVPDVVLSNDVVVKAGMAADCMYFISCGTVAVFSATGKEVCHLTDGAHFGEVALLVTDDRRMANVVAVEPTELYLLSRADFLRVIAPDPKMFQLVLDTAKRRYNIIREIDSAEGKTVQGRRLLANRFAQASEWHTEEGNYSNLFHDDDDIPFKWRYSEELNRLAKYYQNARLRSSVSQRTERGSRSFGITNITDADLRDVHITQVPESETSDSPHQPSIHRSLQLSSSQVVGLQDQKKERGSKSKGTDRAFRGAAALKNPQGSSKQKYSIRSDVVMEPLDINFHIEDVESPFVTERFAAARPSSESTSDMIIPSRMNASPSSFQLEGVSSGINVVPSHTDTGTTTAKPDEPTLQMFDVASEMPLAPETSPKKL